MGRKDEKSERADDYMCGMSGWRPRWLQKLASPEVFLFNLALTAIIQGGSYKYFVASMSTLERRYAFSSTISGLIMMGDNISELFLCPILGFLAHRFHRPRLIGLAQMTTGFGLYVAALPYFIYGPGVHLLTADPTSLTKYSANKTVDYCDSSRDLNSECLNDGGSSSMWWPVFFVFLSCFLNGIGSSAYFTIGIPFVDDSVQKKHSPIYLSAAFALKVIGPTIGFTLSSLVLQFYEDPSIDPGIKDTTDPRWIGAWWIGFMVLGTAIILISIPMLFYPREFKKVNPQQVTKKKLQIKQISWWDRFMRLMKNPIYLCGIFGTIFRLFAVVGYATFKPKYIESAYKKSASAANLFTGVVGILPTATGIFLGGIIVQMLKPKPRTLTTFTTIVEILGGSGIVFAFFLGCPDSLFDGTHIGSEFQMQTSCNADCSCGLKTFQPMCATDQNTNYFSPCFAGCDKNSINSINGTLFFSDCQCGPGLLKEGYCETDCGNNFWWYAVVIGTASIVANLARAGNAIVGFRVVEPEDKSFSIGLATVFLSIFAFGPYSVVYGAVTDSACLIWEEKCGQKGNCWVYDTTKFRNLLHGLTLGLYIMGSVFDVIVVIMANRIKNLYDDPEEDNNSVDKRQSVDSSEDVHL